MSGKLSDKLLKVDIIYCTAYEREFKERTKGLANWHYRTATSCKNEKFSFWIASKLYKTYEQ